MVENDAVNITAYVRIYKDPTGVLWHNFIKFVAPFTHPSYAKCVAAMIPRSRQGWLDLRTKERPAI